jgi:chromate reductase, NAD(P)H dehydrogenase (quinone)
MSSSAADAPTGGAPEGAVETTAARPEDPAPARDLHIFGVAGSLRRASYNMALLRAAAEMLPSGVTLEIGRIDDIPPYNADVQDSEGDPESVRRLKHQIEECDVFLVATPEYNYSIPGVLKNAIDWVSRPPKICALRKKPVGIMGAASGESGTIRSQLALRQVFVYTDSYVMAQPELRVMKAGTCFDEQGRLIDEALRERLGLFLYALADWARMVGG